MVFLAAVKDREFGVVHYPMSVSHILSPDGDVAHRVVEECASEGPGFG
jgi:hypothetical protein